MTDPAKLRPYRTELPNILDDAELSVYAFRLYAHIKRVAGDSGTCYEATRTMSDKCHMSMGKVSEAKQELIEKGYIRQIGQRPMRGGSVPEFVIIDKWQENYNHFASVHLVNTNEESVHLVNALPEETPESVHEMPESVHLVKQRINMKNIYRDQGDEPQRKKRRQTSPKKTDEVDQATPLLIRTTLAEVCGYDLSVCSKAKVLQVNTVAKRLYQSAQRQNITPEGVADAIRYTARHYQKNDWRGKKGELPSPSGIADIWKAAMDARRVNGQNGYHNPDRARTTEVDLDKGF